MMFPQDWERVTQERINSWEAEMRQRQLLAQIPHQSSLWRRWTGSGLVRTGTLLMRLGERLAQREARQGRARQGISVTS